jgi:hypothetical protein
MADPHLGLDDRAIAPISARVSLRVCWSCERNADPNSPSNAAGVAAATSGTTLSGSRSKFTTLWLRGVT